MEPRSKVLLFLGSGVSLESGMPNVETLTEKLFKISPKELKAVHPFCPSYSPLSNPDRLRGAQQFLIVVKEWAISNRLEDVNYEDLHSLCTKIEQNRFTPRRDPTAHALTDFVHGRIANTDYYKELDSSLQQCADDARRFIDYIIKQELLFPERTPEELDCVLKYIEILGAENFDIITLNHDTLVEQLLAGRSDWTDGFSGGDTVFYEDAPGTRTSQSIDYLSEESLLNSSKVRLVKPHGSCNWYKIERNDTWKWCIPRDGWRETFLDENNQPISESPFDAGPISGSFTKESSYLFGPTGVMFHHACRILREYDRLICSGYGWKDHGINRMIIDWIQQNTEKRIAVLQSDKSPNFKSIQSLVHQWTAASQLNRTIIHPSWLSEVEPSEVLELLNVR